MANTYSEPASALNINASRQQQNQTNRALVTNFNSDDAPPTISNFDIEGDLPSSLYNGIIWYNSNTQALYIQNSSRSPAGGYPYSYFTRIGIGSRIIHSEARALDTANIARIEIGEIVVTVNSTDSTNGDTIFMKTGASTLTDMRSVNPSKQVLVNKTQYPAYSFTGDTDTGIASNAANEMGLVAAGNTVFVVTSSEFYTPGATANIGLSTRRWGSVWANKANYSGNVDFMSGAYLADGSLSVPSLSFIADTNTGLYRSAADNIVLVAGGIEGLRLGTDANVGVKTAIPLEAFHVTGRIRYNSNVIGNNSVGNRYVSTSNPTVSDGADGDLWFKI